MKLNILLYTIWCKGAQDISYPVAVVEWQIHEISVLLARPHIDIDQATPSHLNAGIFSVQLEGRHPPRMSGSRTALMYAALGGSGDATALLVAHGAHVHQKDAEALEAAQYAHSPAVSRALANAGMP
jgi:hypothetical protein